MDPKEFKNVVVIGGGTGTFTILTGLKKYSLDITVIVSMMDSGGSNRIIRDEFGLLPTSDLRQCMVALASEKSHEMLRQLFTYRYSVGIGISGMTFGNLFIAALTDIYGSQEIAIEKTCEILDVQGSIIPVTLDNVYLSATYDNGTQVLGEHFIDQPTAKTMFHKIKKLEVIPLAKASKKALNAIKNADMIILGPGDLYTSIICNLVIGGISRAIIESKAKKLFVMNLMTKYGQTDSMTANDHLHEIEKYLKKNVLDYCLINKTNTIPQAHLTWYKKADTYLVKDDVESKGKLKVIRGNFASGKVYKKDKSDKLERSLIRHDSDKLAKAIMDLL